MSDTERPSDSEQGEPVDPERLAQLLRLADRLRGGGEEDVLRRILEGLHPDERSIYAGPLSEHLTEYLDVTIESQLPGSNELGDETIAIFGDYQPAGFASSPTDRRSDSGTQRLGSDSSVPSKGVDPEHDFDAGIPDRIGKFLIRKELGRGAFGVVYLGFDQELQRNVAVKVSLVSDPKLQERLRVEASKLAQAESPGIVPVYHIGRTQDGKVYIVQKYVEGTTLRHVLRKHPLSPLAAVALMREIAVGLAPAHAMDILHRDLKPDNILIENGGKSWIADFGLAISEDEQIDHRRELAGTPPYMSPEQIRGRIDFLDPRSDIWSLGVMFYELLTGKLPFGAKDRKTLTEQICEMDPRPLQQRAPGLLTESMNEVFLRCCAKKPSDRYSTVTEFVSALDGLADEGLSDTNIDGEITDVLGLLSGDRHPNLVGSSPGTTRGQASATQRHAQTTRATQRTMTESIFESVSPRYAGWGLAAVALCCSVVGIVGYQLYAQRSDAAESSNQTASQETNSGGDSATARTADASALGDGSREKPWIVSPGSTGTHATIQAAVAEASAGDFIRVTAGLYRDPLLITKPITIEGEPPKAGVYPCVIENDQQAPVTIDCPEGFVKLRSFMISGKGHRVTSEFNPIEVSGGGLELESCALETRSQNCIKVRADARLKVLACKFLDSSEFAISATGFSQIELRGSDFFSHGVEVTGGTGEIESCKFLGPAGIYVANNLEPVKSDNCLFEKNSERSLFATDGGRLEVNNATIRESKTAVGATDQPMTKDAPLAGRPGEVKLFQSRLERCVVGLQVEGGKIEASDECFIDGAQIAVGVASGVANLTDLSISRVREKAVVVYDGGTVVMDRSNISGCDQTAVKLLNGTFTFSEGVIEDFLQHGIVLGDKDAAERREMTVNLTQATLRTSTSKLAGLTAYCGRVVLNGCRFEGAKYGIYLDGQAFEDAEAKGPSVSARVERTRFEDQTGFAIVALGQTRLVMDPTTQTSANASGGLKPVPPAEIVLDQRGE